MTKNISTISFYSLNKLDALSHLRLMAPARQLGLNIIEGLENGQVYPERVLKGDIAVLQREFPKLIEAYIEVISLARQKQIPVILDLDDLLFELPVDHPDRVNHVYTETFLPIYLAIMEADVVTVTTKRLRDQIIPYNKNVIVLPNYLDDQIWHLAPPPRKTNQDEKLIIGYMGGLTHQSDLETLEPVVLNLLNRYPGKLEFHFWGTKPSAKLLLHPSVHSYDQIIWDYPDFASFFQTQSADILMAPLANNNFNNCKSCIKYLEYSSLGAPGVYSKVEPYSNVITHGKNGLLASTRDEWIDCLVQLIENQSLRFTIATNAQTDIKANWLLSKNASSWLAAYQQACTTQAEKVSSKPDDYTLIKSLTSQTVMWEREKTKKICDLENLAAQQEQTISAITNSKTWKLALVFRQIRTFIAPPDSRRTRVIQWIINFVIKPFK